MQQRLPLDWQLGNDYELINLLISIKKSRSFNLIAMRGVGFEPTNLYRMRCPSQISSNSFATKTTSEHRDDAWIHSRHQSHAVDQAWQPPQ